jgi:hypothetical protein
MFKRQSLRTGHLRVVLSGVVIAFSVVGAWLVIESSKVTEVYLVTKKDLASGTALTESDLALSDLALFALGEKYLKAGELPQGAYLIRSISEGEAIPKAAVTTQQLASFSNVVLTPTVELSSAIAAGTRVSVWASPALDYQNFGEPAIAALDVEVIQIKDPVGSFAQEGKSVELRVPITSIPSLLRSIANSDAIALTASSASLGN